jgi:carbamate kinase
MRLVVALGGNALLRRGEEPDAEAQRRNVAVAVGAIAELAREHEVVVTHGNGPQIGLLALQGEADPARRPYPLDVLGAETEGMVGYMLDQELANALPDRSVATLLTQVVVDPDDPAFDQADRADLRPRPRRAAGGREGLVGGTGRCGISPGRAIS